METAAAAAAETRSERKKRIICNARKKMRWFGHGKEWWCWGQWQFFWLVMFVSRWIDPYTICQCQDIFSQVAKVQRERVCVYVRQTEIRLIKLCVPERPLPHTPKKEDLGDDNDNGNRGGLWRMGETWVHASPWIDAAAMSDIRTYYVCSQHVKARPGQGNLAIWDSGSW